MAEDRTQAGQGESADSGVPSEPAPEPAAAPAAGAPEPAAAPASPAVFTDDAPGWSPRSGFRNLTGYEPDLDETNVESDVTRWYTASEGGLSTGAINPPGLAAQIGYADFWARFAAQVLDAIVIYLLTYACLLSGVGVVAIPILLLGYFPFFWIRYGATPGMSVCGLRILRAVDGEAIDFSVAALRFLIFVLEIVTIVGLAGFLVAAFEKRKRAVHDLIAGTIVVQAEITTD
jgi:uncharacterized RDD family membrane protein YckC